MKDEYAKAIEEYRMVMKHINGEKLNEQETKFIEREKKEYWDRHKESYDPDGVLDHRDFLEEYLHENNSFENYLPEDISGIIREDRVEMMLNYDGGYPLLDGGDFIVDGIKYGVTVFGVSRDENPILGTHFVRYENKEK